MREDAEIAAELSADGHPAWRAGTSTILGVARWLTGDRAGAEVAFASAIVEGSPFNVIAEIGALSYLSIVMGDEGRWSEAEGLAERARRRFTEAELGFSGPMIVVPLAEARVLAHGGTAEIDGQVEVVEDAVHRLSLPPWLSLVATVILAEMALERGDIEAVQRGIASGLRILRGWPDAGVLAARLEHLRQALEERRLAGHLTPAERRVLDLLATHMTSLEIARKLGVSPNTMKSHVRDIFRKLGAHSRGEAIERAREVGLLRA
jgi:LuxR family maltose regulon positive regulatory protein